MDEKDLKILAILAENSRTPSARIARALGISDVAVKKRIIKLEREGVIKGYGLEVNPSKLGYSSIACVGINVSSESLLDVAKELSSREDVVFVALTSGDHDIMIELWAKDGSEMQLKLKAIRSIKGVENVYPAIILEIVRGRESLPKVITKPVT